MSNIKNWIQFYWQWAYLPLVSIFLLTLTYYPYSYSWLLKILPIAILILLSSTKLTTIKSILFTFGLIFSIIGDFILDYYSEAGFIWGLASFFIAHIFYIFSLGQWDLNSIFKRNKRFLFSCITVTYGVFIIYLLTPKLGSLLIPVIAYMIILFSMAMTAIYSKQSNHWIIIGGLSFLLSDSLLGLNKFFISFEYAHILVLASYYLAQYSLVRGFLSIIKK